jgi:glucose/arabinose dehydrogenase
MTAAVWGRRSLRSCCSATAILALLSALSLCGCVPNARILSIAEQKQIDRSLVEYSSGYKLQRFVADLTAPTAIAFDADGSILIAEGERDEEVRIIGFRKDGAPFNVWPLEPGLLPGFATPGAWRMYGPVGGMVCYQGRILVSHRDADGMGVITSLDYHGNHKTIVGNLPAQGDYGVTDLAISPNGRLYFGVGTATNSGVVGPDNWTAGWVRSHPGVHDQPWHDVALLGYRFDSTNPLAGLFGPSDLAITAIFQAFNHSNQTRVRGVADSDGTNKPNGAIYWVSPDGGFPTVEAHGIHNPRGLVINEEYGTIYFTNCGMEMRGTRPVKDDPDALLRLLPGTHAWYGWPDYTADLQSVGDPRFQPPQELLAPGGYPELRPCIDTESSHLIPPIQGREILLKGVFPSLSGASRIDLVPEKGPFKEFRGNVIVALCGDRAPFATSGRALADIPGYKVVRVDPDTHQVKDFIRNTSGKPRSRAGGNISLLERPIDVKFAPDGSVYILDFGQMEMRDGHEHIIPGTGQIFRLVPISDTPETPANRAGVEVR